MPTQTYFQNTGGINLANSPFAVSPNQATEAYCFEYSRPGAIVKTLGKAKINAVADAQLRSHGFSVFSSAAGVKQVLRAAGTKLQTMDVDSGAFTTKSSDAATPVSDFFTATSTQAIATAAFDTAEASVTWLTGAGAASIYGYNGTSVTTNGVVAPTGTLGAVVGGSGGSFAVIGNYYYAVALKKNATDSVSNAALDVQITIAATTEKVTLTFPVGIDATLYDQWYVYRSILSGVSGFTAGVLVAQVATTEATYIDDGVTAVSSTALVPRTDSAAYDNSVLPSGTYTTLAAFKRRLVTSKDNTLYISEFGRPESWSADLRITMPYGGPIKALGVVGSMSDISDNTDEFLIILQERNVWIISGTFAYDSSAGLYDFELKFVDKKGCPSQALVVSGDGFISWIDYNGVYIWDGVGKPMVVSRPIKNWFDKDGDLDKSKLNLGWGVYFQKKNQFVWTLSHRTLGENQVQLKLDLSLTVPKITTGPGGRYMDGIFLTDTTTPLASGISYLPANREEIFISGDSLGFTYKMYSSASDDGLGIPFSYRVPFLDQGSPGETKRYKKVLVWVDPIVQKDLTLNYWANYRNQDSDRSVIAQPMGTAKGAAVSLWDVAVCDVSFWDSYENEPMCVVFNLHAKENNVEGDCIMLEFQQLEASAPVVIHGFSIVYDNIGIRK